MPAPSTASPPSLGVARRGRPETLDGPSLACFLPRRDRRIQVEFRRIRPAFPARFLALPASKVTRPLDRVTGIRVSSTPRSSRTCGQTDSIHIRLGTSYKAGRWRGARPPPSACPPTRARPRCSASSSSKKSPMLLSTLKFSLREFFLLTSHSPPERHT
ncbi:uncharacterized protein LOC123395034 [Hordeum vulgare subsp. vulgare]|uniref:uncharacterized protein LOC123395034 n=1 Tax=Hordeum vulgare subsp. vulgare TaxID=112509 RepID=UPI001D1A54D8|nr:uncharacterized protein LOC123395034 [Hordeum vulgare subsp. vulgare]